MKFFHLLLPVLCLGLTSCAGYRLGSVKPTHLEGVTKIAIPTFTNNTLEPRLGALVTNAVMKQIQMDGSYQVVPRDQAEAVLEGEISKIDRSQFRSVRTNVLRTSELMVRLRTDFKLVSAADGTTLHRGVSLGESNIVLGSNFQSSEQQGLEDAAQELAVSLTSAITEGW